MLIKVHGWIELSGSGYVVVVLWRHAYDVIVDLHVVEKSLVYTFMYLATWQVMQ